MSGLTTQARVTLPSVDGWNGSMVIQRDPPKSIHTRRKDKVFDTQQITRWIDGSSDRTCENIRKYARGVNPMVSVSYSNNGNNGGTMNQANGLTANKSKLSGGQAFLPYRVMREGAFRPPILTQRQLLPLSRLPRNATSAFTQVDFPNYAKKLMCPEKCRAVLDHIIHTPVQPTASYKLGIPVSQPMETKYMLTTPLNFAVGSGVARSDPTFHPTQEYTKGVGNVLQGQYGTNPGRSAQVVDLAQGGSRDKVLVNDKPTYAVGAPVSSYTRQGVVAPVPEQVRTLPIAPARTNLRATSGMDIWRNMSRTKKLAPSLSVGGFSGCAAKPAMYRDNQQVTLRDANISSRAYRRMN